MRSFASAFTDSSQAFKMCVWVIHVLMPPHQHSCLVFFFLLFLLNCSCFALDRRQNVHLATANGVSANATCIRYCGNGLCVHGDRDRRCTALLHHATIHTLLLSCSCCKSLPNFPRPCNLPLLHLYGTSCDMPFPLRFQSVYTYTFCSLRLPLNTL